MFCKRETTRQQTGPLWAFPGTKPGSHKSRQAVWKDVKRAAKAFRLKQNVAPQYGDIRRVQRAMEHGSPAVTAIYVMAGHVAFSEERPCQAAEAETFG